MFVEDYVVFASKENNGKRNFFFDEYGSLIGKLETRNNKNGG